MLVLTEGVKCSVIKSPQGGAVHKHIAANTANVVVVQNYGKALCMHSNILNDREKYDMNK